MISQSDMAIIQEAASMDPEFAQKYGLTAGALQAGVNQFSSEIIWNGESVNAVPPSTMVQFYANLIPGWYIRGSTMFRVVNTNTGIEEWHAAVTVGLSGSTYVRRVSPSVEGTYSFDPDYGNPDSVPVTFTVAQDAQNPNPPPKTTNWLLIGGIVAAAGAAVAVVTLVGDRKKK
jgi:hypothetical protein